jgi:hypothetical protein
MSDKYRIVVELYSDSNPDLVERKILEDKEIKPVNNIYDLGLRHTEQISIVGNIQQEVLNCQSKFLREDIKFCPKCGSKVIKHGYDNSKFHSVFTDHVVKTQRLKCAKCPWKSTPSVKSLFGTSIHPDLAKIQSELGANHSYRESEKILDLQGANSRPVNNHDRIKHIVSHIGKEIEVENRRLEANFVESTPASKLIIQVDGGHLKSSEDGKRSFEVMTSIVYKPESVGKVKGEDRGKIYNKNCAASALDDGQESIKRDTLIAGLRQGMTKTTEVTAICDGANNCWSIINYLKPYCKEIIPVLDWFHVGMKFKNTPVPKDKRDEFDKIKWHLWHGSPDRAIEKLKALIDDVPKKHHLKLNKLITYIDNNKDYIVNYEIRYKNNLVFTSNVAECNVESLINQRCKRQKHMIWSREGAQPLLQVRAAIHSNEWNQRWEDTVLTSLKNAAA